MYEQINAASLNSFAKDQQVIAAQSNLLNLRVIALAVRYDVDSYVEPILMRYRFTDENREPITKTIHLYRSSDEYGINEFFAELDAVHRLHGYDIKPGTCPALRAEYAVIDAETHLLRLASKHFGIDFDRAHGETRRKAIELFSQMPRA